MRIFGTLFLLAMSALGALVIFRNQMESLSPKEERNPELVDFPKGTTEDSPDLSSDPEA